MPLMRLSLFLALLTGAIPGAARAESTDSGTTRYTLEFKQPGTKPLPITPGEKPHLEPSAFRIRNDTGGTIQNVKVLGKEDLDLYDVSALVKGALGGTKTDREKAEAMWRLVQRYMYQSHPAHADARLHDPLVMFWNYGYGYCDDFAWNLASLWREVGLNSRVWGLAGHVVSEVQYDGGWHMYDAHKDVAYTTGSVVLDVETLSRRPELVEAQTPGLGYLYATREDNVCLPNVAPPRVRTIDVSLRPGESWERRRFVEGDFYDTYMGEKPSHLGASIFAYRPDFSRHPLNALFAMATNVEVIREEGMEPALQPTAATVPGALLLHHRQPFVVLKAGYHVRGEILRPGGNLEVLYSRDKNRWTPVKRVTEPGEFDIRGEIQSPLLGATEYWLTLAWAGFPAEGFRVYDLEVRTETQNAYRSFPGFSRKNPDVRVSFDPSGTAGEGSVLCDVEFEQQPPAVSDKQ
jgi:hypothetical protein